MSGSKYLRLRFDFLTVEYHILKMVENDCTKCF